MKTLTIFLLSAICFGVSAQTDSLKQNLERHKSLYEQGLITEQEYEMLKKKELNLLAAPKAEKEIKPQQYKSKLISGALGFAGGLGLVTGGMIIKVKQGSGEKKHSIQEARVLFAAGAVCGGLGIGLMAKGARLRAKYFDAQLAPSSVSVRMNF